MNFKEETLRGFKEEPYKFLSNMHLCPVLLDGVIYPSSENAYQAAKTENRAQFTNINPYEAKKLGRRVPLKEGFDRLASMEKILRSKFYAKSLARDNYRRIGRE